MQRFSILAKQFDQMVERLIFKPMLPLHLSATEITGVVADWWTACVMTVVETRRRPLEPVRNFLESIESVVILCARARRFARGPHVDEEKSRSV